MNTITDATPPTLAAGDATRTGETTATVKFTSDEAGSYYYAVVESVVAAPTIDTSGEGTSCTNGENAISLTTLSGTGAKDIYIVVKDAAGNVSQPLKITIPAIYTLTVNLNGGSFADASSASTTFTMPAADTTITANWQYDSPYIPPTYAVTTPETTGGTVTVSPSRASSGRTVTITAAPDTGFALESLTVLDSRGNEIALTDKGGGKYTFTMPASRVTVEASFAPAPLPFEDVAPGAWYESAVRYAYTHDIMEGMSATKFSPNISLTRAQAVQVLYNLEGQPTVSGNAAFPDQVEEWYKPAIAWAEQTGVVDGYEDGTFRPGQPVNRMEFAQMLYNYAKYKGYDLTAQGDLTAFPDGDSVQPWAETAMTWANGNQLINGHDDGTLEPGGTTTRAQAASILMRFDQNVVEN